MSSDRVELHRRLAKGKWEAYANALDTRRVSYPAEWIFTADATIMCPRFNEGEPTRLADHVTPEALALMAEIPDGDILTPELVSPFDCTAEEWGFAVHDIHAGTRSDGKVLQLHEWDYIWTDENGHICRWDWFVDSNEWNPYLELIGLEPEGLTYQAYLVNFLKVGGKA
jgi:hypothetical protein